MATVTANLVPTVQHNATVYNAAPQANEPGRRFVRTFKAIGVTQLVLGSLSIALAIVAIIIVAVQEEYDNTAYVAAGTWCGVFFVVAGILGIVASKQPGHCQVNALMAFSILSAITSMIMMSIEGSAAGNSSIYYFTSSRLYPLHVVLSLIGAAEFIVSITNSALCCSSVCCGTSYASCPTTIVTTTTTPAPMVAPGHFITVQGVSPHGYQPILHQPQVSQYQVPPQPYGSYPVAPQPVPYQVAPQQNPTMPVLPQQVPPQPAPQNFQAYQSPAMNPNYQAGAPPNAAAQPPPYSPQADLPASTKG